MCNSDAGHRRGHSLSKQLQSSGCRAKAPRSEAASFLKGRRLQKFTTSDGMPTLLLGGGSHSEAQTRLRSLGRQSSSTGSKAAAQPRHS